MRASYYFKYFHGRFEQFISEFKNENNNISNQYVELIRKFIFSQFKHIRGIMVEDEEKTNCEIPKAKAKTIKSLNRKQTWSVVLSK